MTFGSGKSLALLVGFLTSTVVLSHGEAEKEVDFTLEQTVLTAKLPEPLSDHTANLDPASGLAYIAGGCNSPLGNEFNAENDFFECGSISMSLYSFDTATETFSKLADMPRARYRQAAVLVNGQLWLVGGRTLIDDLIGEVDVYDIASDTWTTFEDLDEQYWSSDLAGFGSSGRAYFAGGYNSTYGAKDTMFIIDVDASNSQSSLVVEEGASLVNARGDIQAVVDENANYAYVSGGFTDANYFCEPFATVEQYTFDTGSWAVMGSVLETPRADKVLVSIDHHIVAIGGETQIEGRCDPNSPTPEAGELTVPVDDVEILDNADNEWQVLNSIPEHRFRFAAVGLEDRIYAFGGQGPFNATCQCHRTTKDVTLYTELYIEDPQDEDPTDEDPPVGEEPSSDSADPEDETDTSAASMVRVGGTLGLFMTAISIATSWVA